MDRSSQITLVSKTYSQDSIGQYVATETQKTIFCELKSVTQNEFFEGGRNGLNPQYQANVLRYEYNDEAIAILNGKRYAIYRTYTRQDEITELYLQNEGGVSNG